MTTFNLIDHSWIPVRWLPEASGDKPALVSLHDAFARSREIADLDAAPHERIALTRLLVCIAHAALGAPDDEDDWDGFGDHLEAEIPAYLGRSEIRPHFDLLGDGPRFLQLNQEDARKVAPQPTCKAFFHLSSGNGPTLLDHWGEHARPWEPASLALSILCLQNFFVGGSMGPAIKGNGPAIKSLQLFVQGKNLGDTILANCLDHQSLAHTGLELGKPVWETPPDQNLLSRLVPATCSLWLTNDFHFIYMATGTNYLEYESCRDPYVTPYETEQGKRYLLRAKPSQGIWRDLHLLTNLSKAEGSNAPLNLQCFEHRSDFGEQIDLWTGELMKAKDAKIEDTAESTFTIPRDFFGEAGRNRYAAGVDHAETVSRKLYGAIKAHGSALSHQHPPVAEGQKHFWHRLDQNHRVLIDLAANSKPGQPAIGSHDAQDEWTVAVRRAAVAAYEAVCPRTTPRQIQAFALGYRTLHRALRPKPPKKSAKPPATA